MAAHDHSVIAKRYARALFDLASEQKRQDAVARDLQALVETAEVDAEFKQFLRTFALPKEIKAKSLGAVLQQGKAESLSQEFIARLVMNGRLPLLLDIAEEFFALAAIARGELAVEAVSAKPLSAKDANALEQALAAKYGKHIHLTSHVDESLVGGLVLNIGDTRIDYSVSGALSRLKHTLKTASLTAA